MGIVRLLLEFRSQAIFPGEIDIGSRIDRIGRLSITLKQGLLKGEVCFTIAESVLVWTDLDTGRLPPFPPEVKSVLETQTGGAA